MGKRSGSEWLTALKVSRLKEPGYHADGGGLYLAIAPMGSKSWIFRFKLHGKAREMGLGPLHTIGLAEAREKARECRLSLLNGIDPIEARKALRSQSRIDAAKSMVFSECAEKYIAAHRAGWKNVKHVSQWENTLATYCGPVFGSLPVQSVDTPLVMRCLEKIWHDKPETASRLRGRIESVLDWATVQHLRAGDNPARWKGHLDNLLPAPSKVKKVEHHPALPYAEIGAFMIQLCEQEGIAAMALEFLILTAARTGEVIGATWSEFDLDAKEWTVPPERMKAKKEHRVPLSARAVEIIEKLRPVGSRGFESVFPGAKPGKGLSNMAMLALLKRMERTDLTAHGFRSTFRDWAAEQTNYPREVAEAALAHTIESKVEAAYRRGDLFKKRTKMMADWARYCSKAATLGEVVPIRKAG